MSKEDGVIDLLDIQPLAKRDAAGQREREGVAKVDGRFRRRKKRTEPMSFRFSPRRPRNSFDASQTLKTPHTSISSSKRLRCCIRSRSARSYDASTASTNAFKLPPAAKLGTDGGGRGRVCCSGRPLATMAADSDDAAAPDRERNAAKCITPFPASFRDPTFRGVN
jgi:hypothetical protein